MYEYISENGGDFTPLTTLKLLQPGGAALSDDIVKALITNGVNVKTTYGSTEIGPPLRSIPHTRDNPKCYSFRNLYPDNPLIKMEEIGKGVYECIIYKGFELAAELWEGKPDDEPYRTSDLFIQDPPGSGSFVLQGRKDDILVHSNGENTNAGPLQLDIQSSSKTIHKVLVLGHSKPCVSLLVEAHEDYDPENESTRTAIWEAIQQVNTRYPSHSQITHSMIHYLPKGNTLPITPKGNARRKEAERLYATSISQLYSDPHTSLPSSSSQPLAEYIRTLLSTLSQTPTHEINNWTTLYDLGIDSRLALSLRTSLSSHLARPISLSSIFENPSISKLVSFLSSSHSEKVSATETTQCIISKLEAEFKSWPPRPDTLGAKKEKEVVLLTGASGSLGTALLQTLSSSARVEKIYAMVRGPNHRSKLSKSLGSRGMDTSVLDIVEGGNGKIEVVNFSMQDPLLGLDIEKYAELARKVTVVVANAWKMDFNLGVEEFEGDCLRSLFPFPLIIPLSHHYPSFSSNQP
jgi:hypothetical protein